MTHVIGIDSSTTATKALLLAPDGSVVDIATAAYGFDTPRPGWTEQHPDKWWEALTTAVSAITARNADIHIGAIGLTGQMHGSVLLDAGGRVVRPAILWNDQRTEAEVAEIREIVGDRLIPFTGNDVMTGFTAPKLLWVRRHDPEAWRRVRHVLLPKDYLRFRLTGTMASDVTDASGTSLLSVAERAWSTELMEALALDGRMFPPVLESAEPVGTLTAPAAAELGLGPETIVVAGAGDQAANAVGVGVVDPGTTALSLGTSGVIFAPTDHPVIEPAGRVHSFCHASPGRWHLMSVMLSAAGSFRWFRDVVAPGMSFAELTAEAEAVPPGADGLVFLPYLTGERTPHADAGARGAFVGLTVAHGRAHMARAVMEGVAFGLRDGLDLMLAAGLPRPTQIRASGGGLASSLWAQIVADALGAELVAPATQEGAALGAAILARVGLDETNTVSEAANALVKVSPLAEPAPNPAGLDDALGTYRALYPAIRPWM